MGAFYVGLISAKLGETYPLASSLAQYPVVGGDRVPEHSSTLIKVLSPAL
jgi:hypothetical protein